MNRRFFVVLPAIAALSLALLSATLSVQAADPTVAGTWELNPAKSKSTGPMPKSTTRTYEVTGTTEKLVGTIVTADGKTIPIAFTATLDGKDNPYQSPGVDMLALVRVDALTTTFTTKLAGKVVATGSRVLSADGKTMTLVNNGVNPAGQSVQSTMVYDRK